MALLTELSHQASPPFDRKQRRIVFLVWSGVSLTSNFGVRNPAFPGSSFSEWENPPLRGFLRAHKKSRQESPRFRLSAAGGVKPLKATPRRMQNAATQTPLASEEEE
jgi:hypothetical protein